MIGVIANSNQRLDVDARTFIASIITAGGTLTAKQQRIISTLFKDMKNGLGTGVNLYDSTKMADCWPIVGGVAASVIKGIFGNNAALGGTYTVNTNDVYLNVGSFQSPFSIDDLGGVFSGQLMLGSTLHTMGAVVYSPLSRKVIERVTGNIFRHYVDSATQFDIGSRAATKIIMNGRNSDTNVYIGEKGVRTSSYVTTHAITRTQNSNSVKLWYGTINGNTTFDTNYIGLVANFKNITNTEAALYFSIFDKFGLAYGKI